MSVIVLLIAAGGSVAAGFLAAFVWAVRSGQFDDTCTPPIRVLLDDTTPPQTGGHPDGARRPGAKAGGDF
jgi:cbb3-type cytochrome oxidase maturation protein